MTYGRLIDHEHFFAGLRAIKSAYNLEPHSEGEINFRDNTIVREYSRVTKNQSDSQSQRLINRLEEPFFQVRVID